MQERCPWLEEVDSEFVRSHANDTTETFTDLLARAAESRLEGNAVRAIQRMNQAWLLKPEDPRCYAAFGGILAQTLDSLSSEAPTDTFDTFFAPNPTLLRLSSLYFLQEALVRGMDTVESLQQAGIASLAAAWDLLDTGETLADIVIQTEGLENVTTDLLIREAVSLLNDALVRQNASSSTLWALTLVSDASTRMTRGDWSGAREDHRLATTYVKGDTPSHSESLSWFYVVLQRLDAFLSQHDP
ncbi:hypothetical protein Poli38472_010790 [Pythium oligandrum]|uniref:Uncharacterized protein n=1 Tax=Pythium oligandrum TaxID=41045 RepID=A0A8K1FJE8_PYTOL|nr:hypothetical protein Poli38472_010790 [Pythium oligandrum]|eukprot:TMW61727.1 hypothetical protein Poli38472_010790 [Pythium oligandrum]